MTSSADESAEIVNAWEAICWPNFKTAPIKDEALDQLRREIAAALDRVSGQALERAATLIDAECARVLSKQTAGKCDPRYEDSVNLNLRMMAVLLPDLAASVRVLIPGGK